MVLALSLFVVRCSLLAVVVLASFFIGGGGIGSIRRRQRLHPLPVVFDSSLFVSSIDSFVHQWYWWCWLRLCVLVAVMAVVSFFISGDGFGYINHWQQLHSLLVVFNLSLFVSGIGSFIHQWHWWCWLRLRVLLAVLVVASFFVGGDGFGFINHWQRLHSSSVVFNSSSFVSSIG